MLPNRIFFTGVPGSRWSGIAQILETIPGFNTSDRSADREYLHGAYSGHCGAYFGTGMEFESYLNPEYLDGAWKDPGGTRLIKSHEWSLKLPLVKQLFPNDWVMLVYRPNYPSYDWWHQAGGFKIKYPDYNHYKDSRTMLQTIVDQNSAILKFAADNKLLWTPFKSEWIESTFGASLPVDQDKYGDVAVTIFK
jgi:hypothetical protein